MVNAGVLRVRGGQAGQVGDRGRLQRQRHRRAGRGRRAGLREPWATRPGKAANASAQSQTGAGRLPGLLRCRRGADAESIADEVGAMTALALRHLAVVAAGRARRGAARLERHRAARRPGDVRRDHGQRPGLHHRGPAGQPARQRACPRPRARTALSPCTPYSSARGRQAPADAATKRAAKPSAASTTPASDNQAVPAEARFGIPCVY